MNDLWDSVVLPLLEITKPGNILQIGFETNFNHEILDFAMKNNIMVNIYGDSNYTFDLGNYRNMYGNIFEVYNHLSIEKILALTKYDIIFIDGNLHFNKLNKYLNLIFKTFTFKEFPIILFFNISNSYEEYESNTLHFNKYDYKSTFKNNNIKSSIFNALNDIIYRYKEFSFYYTSKYDGLSILFLEKYYIDVELKNNLYNSSFFEFLEKFNYLKNIPIINNDFQYSKNTTLQNYALQPDTTFSNNDEMNTKQNFSNNNFSSKNIISKKKLFKYFNLKNVMPLVSIIITNNGDIDFLKKFFNEFNSKIGYSNYEILFLNKQYADDTINFLKSLKLPIKILNANSESSSINKNNLVKYANGDYLCFLNGDILPNEEWLNELMKICLSEKKVGIIGSSIIFNNCIGSSNNLSFEKRFIPFYSKQKIHDLLQNYCEYGISAFLVNKQELLEINGFNTEYSNGIEDIDLSLKFIKKGYVNYKSINSSFNYNKSYSQSNLSCKEKFADNEKNIFIKNWKLFLKKFLFLDKFNGINLYGNDEFNIIFVIPYSFLETFKNSNFLRYVHNNWNYDIIYNEKDVFDKKSYEIKNIDMLISFTTKYDLSQIKYDDIIKISWFVDNNFSTNINYSDITIVSNINDKKSILESYAIDPYILDKNIFFNDSDEMQIIKSNFEFFKNMIIDYVSKIKIFIKIGAPNWIDVKYWGDYHFALSLKNELENLGCFVIIQVLNEWDKINNFYDVVLVLRGLSKYNTKPEHLNIMWNISHPEDITNEEYESYDHIFIASDLWAKKINNEVNVPVSPLLQCTDEKLFFTDTYDKYKHDLLFVGNSRMVYRKIIHDLDLEKLTAEGVDLAIYGRDWEHFIPKHFINGDYIHNRELHKVYSSTKILLNDHWEDMAKLGFISNRIFDGFASGTFLLSDYVEGMEKVFENAVVTYSDKNELNELIKYYIENNNMRNEKIKIGKNIVLKHHTFKKRAKFLFDYINNYL